MDIMAVYASMAVISAINVGLSILNAHILSKNLVVLEEVHTGVPAEYMLKMENKVKARIEKMSRDFDSNMNNKINKRLRKIKEKK